MCVHMCACHGMYVEVRDLRESVLSFHHVIPGMEHRLAASPKYQHFYKENVQVK